MTYPKAARILRTIDESVSPCHDFYQFACGKWIETTIIPEHKSSQSTFDDLQDELNKKLRSLYFIYFFNSQNLTEIFKYFQTVLIEEKSVEYEKKSFVKKIKNLYKSCMNTSE